VALGELDRPGIPEDHDRRPEPLVDEPRIVETLDGAGQMEGDRQGAVGPEGTGPQQLAEPPTLDIVAHDVRPAVSQPTPFAHRGGPRELSADACGEVGLLLEARLDLCVPLAIEDLQVRAAGGLDLLCEIKLSGLPGAQRTDDPVSAARGQKNGHARGQKNGHGIGRHADSALYATAHRSLAQESQNDQSPLGVPLPCASGLLA
jgi:hypothetical protein